MATTQQRKPGGPHRVHLVLYPEGGIAGAFVDDPEAATRLSEAAGGVIVSLPVVADHRNKEEVPRDE